LLAALWLAGVAPTRATSPEEPAGERYYRQALRDLRAQRPVEGEWNLIEALRRDPDHFRAHMELAQLYLQPLPELALAHLAEARRLRPAFDQVYFLLGQVYERQGRLLEAADQYRKAVTLNARLAEADHRLKAILRTLRERKTLLERASEQFWRRPNLAALTLYGRVVMQESTPLQALLEFESIRDRIPELPEVNLWIARTQRMLGSWEGELGAYWRYLERAPGADQVRLTLSERLLELGRNEEASRALAPLLPNLDRAGPLVDADVQARTAYLQSRSLVGRGDPARAGELLIRAASFGMEAERIAQTFADYLARYPELASLHAAHGQWLRASGRFDDAAAAYREAGLLAAEQRETARLALRELLNESQAVNGALLGLGEFALAEGRDEEARRLLARIAPADPAGRRAALLLTVLARRAGELDSSLDYALRYILSFPDPAGMAYARGRVLWEGGQPEAAEAVWGEDARLLMRYPDILVRLAGFYERREDRRAELTARELLRDLEPTRLANRRRLGALYGQEGQREQAVAEWESIVRLLPGDYDLRVRLATAELALGRRATALEHLLEASRLRAFPQELNDLLARELLAEQRYSEALEIYWQIYLQRPGQPELRQALPLLALQVPAKPEVRLAAARLAEDQGRIDTAMEILEETLRRYPEQDDARVMLAGLLLRRGDAQEAERVIGGDGGSEALSDKRRLLILAEAQERQGKREETAATLVRIAELAPDDELLRRLAFLLHDLGRHEEAAPLLAGLVDRNGEDREALFRLAQSEFALGRYEPGKARLARLLGLEPGHQEGLRLLIERLLREQRWKEVAPPLEHWVELHPEDSTARFNLITAYLRQFKRDAARPHYEALTTLNPVQARQLAPYFR
jgi:tetratricopeptide (TPR) repeat protein